MNLNFLKETAYKSPVNLEKRSAIYEFTKPRYEINKTVLENLNLREDDQVLDVGCGEAKFIRLASSLYPQAIFVGVDVSLGMFKEISEKLSSQKNISFKVADAQNLPFANHSFDRVVAMHLLKHVPKIELALSEMARVQHPDGLTVITANSHSSRPTLNFLEEEVSKALGLKVFNNLNLRFNNENGLSMINKYYKEVRMIPYESRLILNDPQPYVDYFDSVRDFFEPLPTDKQWTESLAFVRKHIQNEIEKKGSFEELSIFGVFVASAPKIN